MIKTLSPYWLTLPFVSPLSGLTCTEFTLKVYVWSGDKLSSPTQSTWQITKKNPTGSTGSTRVNIANILTDFIQFTPQEGTGTSVIDGNNQRWIKYETFYQTTDITDSQNASNQFITSMLKGYSLGLDLENSSTPTNKVLLNGREFKVSRNSVFVLPVEIDESAIPLPSTVLNSVTPQGSGIFQYDYDLDDIPVGFSGNGELSYRQTGGTTWLTSKSFYGLADGNNVVDSNAITLTGSVEFAVRFLYPETASYIDSNIITLTVALPSVVLNSVTAQGSSIFEYDYDLADSPAGLKRASELCYRQTGDTTWIISWIFLLTDSNNVVDSEAIPLTGSVEFVVRFYYVETTSFIDSNIITLTI